MAPVGARGDGKGLFNRNAKIDPIRVRQLAEILRSDPDEKRRKAAILELGEADPRVRILRARLLILLVRLSTCVTTLLVDRLTHLISSCLTTN